MGDATLLFSIVLGVAAFGFFAAVIFFFYLPSQRRRQRAVDLLEADIRSRINLAIWYTPPDQIYIDTSVTPRTLRDVAAALVHTAELRESKDYQPGESFEFTVGAESEEKEPAHERKADGA